jgi:hypothetical protein
MIFASWIRIRILIKVKSQIRIRIKSKCREAQTRALESRGRSQWRPGGYKWRPVVTEIPITLKRSWIRIRIKVKKAGSGSGSALK